MSQVLQDTLGEVFALPAADAAFVLEALERKVYRGGEWLFHQGDAADSLYLLARGRLQVWIDNQWVADVEPGETIGEIGLLTGGSRSASIRASRDSLLLRMDASTFDRLGRDRPQLVRQLAGSIATRLRERTAGQAARRRMPRTIALLPLDDNSVSQRLVAQLAVALGRHGSVLTLDPTRLAELGAPPLPDAAGDPRASGAMTEWLGALEDSHRFLLLATEAADTAWSRMALRHADLVLLVAAATAEPAPRTWEQSLLDPGDGPAAERALLLLHDGAPDPIVGTGRWLDGRNLAYHLHLRTTDSADLDRLARVLVGSSTGIVLGGGAARGFAHLGVYSALCQAGIPIDWIGGSSIGAAMGVPIARAMDPKDAIDVMREAFVGGKPFSDFTLPLVSLLRGGRLDRLLREHLHEDIEDLRLPYFCLSSNLGQGRVHMHRRGSLAAALRASVALPGVFPPAVVDGQLAIDGGILDNLPVERMRQFPVGRVIAVDVTSRQDFAVDYPAVPSPSRLLAGRLLPGLRRYRVPSFLSLMLKATEIGTMSSVRAAGEQADLLLRPAVGRFSITDVRSFDRIVAAGYDATCTALEGAAWR